MKKERIKNKPWKSWKTRKFSFIYCIVLGTVVILLGGVAIFLKDADMSVWMEQALRFCKFVISTGTILILLPLKDFLNIFKKKNHLCDDENVEEDENDLYES